MEKMRYSLMQLFSLCFGVLFILLGLNTTINHINPFYDARAVSIVAVSVVMAAGFGVLYYLINRIAVKDRTLKRLALLLLLVYFVAQFGVACLLQVFPNNTWDYLVVFAEAENLVLRGIPAGEYFVLYGNNAPLYWHYVILFRIFHALGITQFMLPLVAYNCFVTCLSLWLVYRMAAMLFTEKQRFVAFLFCLLCPGLFLYGTIAYTDTLTLPFVTASMFLWLKGGRKGKISHIAGAFLLAGVGSTLKISAAILIVAYITDALLSGSKKMLVPVVASLVLFGTVLGGGNYLAKKDVVPDGEKMPYSHWMMMGLNGVGDYCDDDYQMVLRQPTYKERQQFIREESIRRLQRMGFSGFVQHIVDKSSFTFSDGTYFAPRKIDHGRKYPGLAHEFVVEGGRYSKVLYYLADGWQLMLIMLCAFSALCDVKNKDTHRFVVRLAFFGLVLFLMIWENRSRYLVHFLTLFLLCAPPWKTRPDIQ